MTTDAFEAPSVLKIPADASFVSTVRIFAGALGRRAELDDERVDDLKLVLSEIAAELIGSGGHPDDVHLRFELVSDERGLQARCRGPLPGVNEEEGAATDHRRRLLEAIVPDATWTREGDERLVSFIVSR